MDSLGESDLADIFTRYKPNFLVEFGTGEGAAAAIAAQFPFDHIYSTEPSHRLAIQAAFRHSTNQLMTFLHGRPERTWREIVREIPAGKTVLFLLGADRLAAELSLLAGSRDLSRDVFIVAAEEANLERLIGASHSVAPLGASRGLVYAAPRRF